MECTHCRRKLIDVVIMSVSYAMDAQCLASDGRLSIRNTCCVREMSAPSDLVRNTSFERQAQAMNATLS